MMPLPGAASGKPAEERDVKIGYQVIADAAVPAIADVILRHQVLRREIPFCSVPGSGFAEAPHLGQFALAIPVDDRRNGLVQLFLGHMPLVDEGHLAAIQAANRARGLRWSEIEAVAEGRDQIALGRVVQLPVIAGNRAERPGPVQPLLRIR